VRQLVGQVQLEKIVTNLPKALGVPVVIIQHMPVKFYSPHLHHV